MKLGARSILFIFLFFFRALCAYGLTANFTADHTIGCAPLVVNFTNTSSGASSYHWDLGNGTTSPGPDASGTYLTPGTYTVTLTAYSGSSSMVHTLIITVNPNPTVAFHASDTSVCPGTGVTFTSTSTAGVPGGLTYIWNFGDGVTSTATSPTHAYTTPGYYNVTLSVTNAQGCVSTLTTSAYVHVFTPAIPNFTVNSTFFCIAPGHAIFANATTGTPGFTYIWSFGDGGTSTAANPVHDYAAAGWYTVKLVVTDGNGCTDSIVRPSYIYVGAINAAFTSPATVCLYSSVTFTNTSSAHIASNWTFGDGGTDTANNGTHVYTTPGTYTVTLIIFDGVCHDTITHTITVLPAPTVSFTISPLNSCPAPATVTMTGSVPAGSTVTWQFGDGSTGSGTPTNHTYGTSGIDTVKMIVTTAEGCKDTVKQVYLLYNLFGDINHDTVRTGCVPLNAKLTCYTWTLLPDSAMRYPYPFGIASYTWNFGDGSPSTSGGSTIYHTYTAVGVYTATVHVITNNGCVADYSVAVEVGTPPHASFTAVPTHICADKTVTFINTTTGPVDAYTWIFGDGTIGYGTDPVDTFKIPGVFTVTLIAYYHGCPDTFIQTNYITVDSPAAIITDSFGCIPNTRMYFADSSMGDDTHLWMFGDGFTSTADNPIHDYPSLGIYLVKLATYNIASGCRDTTHIFVDLTKPVPHFTADDTAICRDDAVHFTVSVTGGTATHYWWYENWVFRQDTVGNYIDTFHTTGIYAMDLVIRDNRNCLDTMVRDHYILVAKPVDTFSAIPPIGCWPLTVNFTDHSTDVPGTFFTSFAWTFGDGATATIGTLSTSHTYTTAGTFDVKEIVTDNIGCKDTMIRPSLITVYRPHAGFYAGTTHPCAGVPVVYTNTSTGITGSFWMFGDGDTSTAFAPSHSYSATGTYTVKLVVTDTHGCTDTANYVNYISVSKPNASFNLSDSFSICAPLVVNFFNTSTGATSYNWFFGDGNSSVAISPSNVYISSGYDTVMLVATNAYGCKDTARRYVNLYGYAGAFTYSPLLGCAPLSVHFNAHITNVPSIIWDFSDGTVSAPSTIDSIDHIYTLPGAYVPKLVLSDGTGCQNSSQGLDTIKVDAVYPGIDVTPAVCLNGTFNFVDSSTSYWSTISSWVWHYDGITSTISSPSHVYTAVGTYLVTLQVSDGWGCTGSISETFTVSPPPVITASPDTTVCVGDPATLTGYGGVSYTWAAPATLSCTACNPTTAIPFVVTTYTVTGKDASGCIGTDTVTVYLRTKTIANGWGDTAVCIGTPVPLFDTGGTSYRWIPAASLDNNEISNPTASPQVTTTYTVIAQLGGCVPDTNYVKVIIYPLPTVDAGPDQTVVAGSTVQLNGTGSYIYTYMWSPANVVSCDTCADPLGTMSVTTTYTLNVTSRQGCKNDDSVTIHVYCDKSQIFMPNSFTPNGDGQNDVYYPRGSGVTIIKSFRIYNRWGELLFERDNINVNDATSAWDGSYNGGTPRADVYVYVVDAICETGQPINIKGDVTIIR